MATHLRVVAGAAAKDAVHPVVSGAVHAAGQRRLRGRTRIGVEVAHQELRIVGLSMVSHRLHDVVRRGLTAADAASVNRQGPVVVHEEDRLLRLFVAQAHPVHRALAVPLLWPVLRDLQAAVADVLPARLLPGDAQRGAAREPAVGAAQARIVQHPGRVLALLEAHDVKRSLARDEAACAAPIAPAAVEQVPPEEVVAQHPHLRVAAARRLQAERAGRHIRGTPAMPADLARGHPGRARARRASADGRIALPSHLRLLALAEHVRGAADHLIAARGVLDAAVVVHLLRSPHAHHANAFAVVVAPAAVGRGVDQGRAVRARPLHIRPRAQAAASFNALNQGGVLLMALDLRGGRPSLEQKVLLRGGLACCALGARSALAVTDRTRRADEQRERGTAADGRHGAGIETRAICGHRQGT
mmetsp:Transcript_70145/g.180814  ORF Transcript_70145/g.180814 Transcript_70145/m.180814 type:complete len:416 (+) Transcript_70145:208-1455(+)